MTVRRLIMHLGVFFCFAVLCGCDRQEKSSVPEETQPAPRYAGTIIAVGDSLTAGLGVDEDDAWPALLQGELTGSGLNWEVVNGGISGETSTGALARIKWIAAQEPEIVLLETGANDGLRGIDPDFIRENISKSVRMLQDEGVTVVLAGMQMLQNLGPEYTEQFAAVYPAVCEQTGCILIPFFLDRVAGEASLNQDDVIHPNEKGHIIIAETVYPYVLQAIQHHKGNQTKPAVPGK